jgi:hypothetical protein
MSTPVYVPEWVLGDLGLDVSIGDHVDWAVSPIDREGDAEHSDAFASVDMTYEWDLYEASGTVSGTVISIQAIATKYLAGKPKPNGTTAWPTRSTATAWNGGPSATGFIFEVEPGPRPAP